MEWLVNTIKYWHYKIDKWLNPYKYDESSLGKYESHKEFLKYMKSHSVEDVVNNDILGVRLKNVDGRLTKDNVKSRLGAEQFDTVLWYHTMSVHQVAVKFDSESYFRYQHRSNEARRRLKPLLYPISDEPFDRTHLIPVGYHGSESNDILLVGWDSYLNRHPMQKFEEKVRSYNSRPIIWFTELELQHDGSVVWKTIIMNQFGKVIDQDRWHDTRRFKWKKKMKK